MTLTTYGPIAEKKTIGDLIRHEYNPLAGYTRKAVTVYNRSGAAATIVDPMGYPVKTDYSVSTAYQLAVSGDEANVKGLLLKTTSITALANNGSFTSVLLVRGPAIIDSAQIPINDLNGVAFVNATIVTAMAAYSPPVLANPEQPNTYTQLT